MTRRSTPVPRLLHFQAWLQAQGSSETEQADRIGVTQRCVTYWKTGQRWPTVEALKDAPDALRALADDLERRHG
jgi:hypothetical protein